MCDSYLNIKKQFVDSNEKLLKILFAFLTSTPLKKKQIMKMKSTILFITFDDIYGKVNKKIFQKKNLN